MLSGLSHSGLEVSGSNTNLNSSPVSSPSAFSAAYNRGSGDVHNSFDISSTLNTTENSGFKPCREVIENERVSGYQEAQKTEEDKNIVGIFHHNIVSAGDHVESRNSGSSSGCYDASFEPWALASDVNTAGFRHDAKVTNASETSDKSFPNSSWPPFLIANNQ